MLHFKHPSDLSQLPSSDPAYPVITLARKVKRTARPGKRHNAPLGMIEVDTKQEEQT